MGNLEFSFVTWLLTMRLNAIGEVFTIKGQSNCRVILKVVCMHNHILLSQGIDISNERTAGNADSFLNGPLLIRDKMLPCLKLLFSEQWRLDLNNVYVTVTFKRGVFSFHSCFLLDTTDRLMLWTCCTIKCFTKHIGKFCLISGKGVLTSTCISRSG